MKLYTDEQLTKEVPGGQGRPQKYTEEAAQLRANPGMWGELEITVNATSFAANMKRGGAAAFRPKEAWDVKVRKGRVFIRYIGAGQ